MSIEIQVENIKCGGCAGTIKKKLSEDSRVRAVEVNIDEGRVSILAIEIDRTELCALLLKLGYPETGTAEGIAAEKAKAKSFVSCAVGKVDNLVNK